MATVRLDNVRKSFGSYQALKGIDLDIESGSFLVLLGPSGCGKSTLLNMIAGLETCSEGTISIDDRVVNHVHPKDRDISMVFQSYALYPSMTVRRNITFALEMRGVGRAERAAAADRAAEVLRIGHLLDRKPAQLSGGQRQRVAMGRALVREPKVFLFDEPLSNLDAQLRMEMRAEIRRLHERVGTTTIYVTHDQIEAMTMATKIAVMKDGALMQFGTPDDIYERPATMFVASFIGSPPMSFIPGRLATRSGLCSFEADPTAPGQAALSLPLGLAAPQFDGREVVFGVRPEAIDLQRSDVTAPGLVPVTCPVTAAESTGADVIATLQLGPSSVLARMRPHEIKPGGDAAFLIDMKSCHFFDRSSQARLEIDTPARNGSVKNWSSSKVAAVA